MGKSKTFRKICEKMSDFDLCIKNNTLKNIVISVCYKKVNILKLFYIFLTKTVNNLWKSLWIKFCDSKNKWDIIILIKI